MQLVLPVRRYLTNRHITVPEDWLTACIDWVLSEYSQNKVPFIQEQVYQEWLHADLTELGTCCLPPQIQDHLSTTISGYFPLQTQAAREKADRMLILELTDGTTVVEGMEYRPTPNLSVNLSPGTKVLVYGTIKVRRGILFLTQQNITVLGGKVMDLLEKNDQRNTLITALNTQDIDSQEQPRRYTSNNTQPGTNTGIAGARSYSNSGASAALPTTNEDEEIDFFDDEIFESGFDQDMALENELVQDSADNHEFTEELNLENEFDEDLDEFMSQM
ncbi:recQ-mediated genome instability protein 1-like isoform X3 [Portunus trituberculatus]|uniref:recQ-mediated genome instability protein 1-like isoform X3 n=1 Tax=Portunus trituberculatus TaxID=210409 RepID=UPI001E1D074F|nr:recQ-mediated genome instability protein 1-like isoform X3 [Portunus trituberculatus]